MQQTLEKRLAQLIAVPSVSANAMACHEVIALVSAELQAMGLFVETSTDIADPWVFASTRDNKEPDILLAAHLDVVPAPERLFAMEKRGTRLYGRGVYDMKFAAACYIELFKQNLGALKQRNVGILFTTDEEAGGLSVKNILAEGLRPKVTLLPDGGDNWAIERRAKGLYTINITARGKSAHGSRPWEGENALHALVDIIQILRMKYPSHKPSDPTLSVNRLIGGEAANQVPESASVAVDFRTFDSRDLEAFKLLVAELARIHDLDITVFNDGDPLVFDDTHPEVKSFLEALRTVTGGEPNFCESYGASDARYFAQHDLPCIVVEPNGGGRHSDEEWLSATDLEKYYRLIETWVLALPVSETARATAVRSISS